MSAALEHITIFNLLLENLFLKLNINEHTDEEFKQPIKKTRDKSIENKIEAELLKIAYFLYLILKQAFLFFLNKVEIRNEYKFVDLSRICTLRKEKDQPLNPHTYSCILTGFSKTINDYYIKWRFIVV